MNQQHASGPPPIRLKHWALFLAVLFFAVLVNVVTSEPSRATSHTTTITTTTTTTLVSLHQTPQVWHG